MVWVVRFQQPTLQRREIVPAMVFCCKGGKHFVVVAVNWGMTDAIGLLPLTAPGSLPKERSNGREASIKYDRDADILNIDTRLPRAGVRGAERRGHRKAQSRYG
jgi:hypothetical protein